MPPWNSKRKLFVFTLSYFGEIILRNLHVVCNMCWVYFRFIGLAFFKYHVFSECNKDTWNPIIWQVCHKNWFIGLLLEFLDNTIICVNDVGTLLKLLLPELVYSFWNSYVQSKAVRNVEVSIDQINFNIINKFKVFQKGAVITKKSFKTDYR